MSLVSTVEQLIKSYKVHQTEINDSIQQYRELLQSLEQNPMAGSEESEVADDAETGTDASPGEIEDIELLERALETALRVRTGSEPSKKHPVKNKLPGSPRESGAATSAPMDTRRSSVSSKGSHTAVKYTVKSGGLDRKVHRKAGSSVCSSLVSRPASSNSRKPAKATNKKMIQKRPVSSVKVLHHGDVSGFVSADQGLSTLLPKNKTVKKNVLSASDPGETASVPTPFSNKVVAFSHADESGACSVHQQTGVRVSSDQATKWQSLRNKQNRLWDKVSDLQRKPAPGRSHFMERMRATFPKDWPCGSPDQTRAEVDRLTHRGRDLLLCLAKRIPEEQASGSDKAPGGKENSSASSLTNEKVMLTAEELRQSADRVKQEWKAWDRWRPEGGCLCTTGAYGVWGDGMAAPLPLTVTYTAAEELQELERLRMSAALLQQEIHLEQALLDTLSPQLASIVPGPGCPNPSVLRELYALLGEGGEHFPAIVLDSESD